MEGNAYFHLEIDEKKHVISFPSRVTDFCILSQVKNTWLGGF